MIDLENLHFSHHQTQNVTSFLLHTAVDSAKFNVNKNKKNSQNSEKVKFEMTWGELLKESISNIVVP